MQIYFFLLLLSDIAEIAAVTQDHGLITARVGQKVTFNCTFQDEAVTYLYWYQQRLGGKPEIISNQMKHNQDASMSPGYKERFQVKAQKGTTNLTIRDLLPSDSASYYCGILGFNTVELGEGVFLHVKTSLTNISAVVHQPALEPLQVGGSLNLSCTVFAEACAGEQSFYWFRHGAAQSAVMYHKEGHCETDRESHMKNCTLNLAIRSMSSSDAGMYYCALAHCGEIVFGNGTSVEIGGDSQSGGFLRILVSCLGVSLTVSIMVLFIWTYIMSLWKNVCSTCKGTVSHLGGSEIADIVSLDADILHLASDGRLHQETSPRSVCVYTTAKRKRE